jgi:hypothetical protein
MPPYEGKLKHLTYFDSGLALGGRPRFVWGFGFGCGVDFVWGLGLGFGSGVILCETS